MKISELTNEQICDFLRIDTSEVQTELLEGAKAAAQKLILSRTGIDEDKLDDYADLAIAYLVLVQDMYDNRAYTQSASGANKVVESILGMHERNLI